MCSYDKNISSQIVLTESCYISFCQRIGRVQSNIENKAHN